MDASSVDTIALQGQIDELQSVVNSLKVAVAEALQHRSLSSVAKAFDSGDTSWMIVSSILVIFMTLPGIALFYVGSIREKNALTACMQVFSIACLVTVLWIFVGYSLSFSPVSSQDWYSGELIFGDGGRLFLQGMNTDKSHVLAPNVPEHIFCFFQMGFAIITPALIVGSYVDRMKFSSTLIFVAVWHLLVYCPICHAVWHPKGLFYGKVLDFAGGLVVHMSSGIAGLVSCIIIGPRKGFKEGEKFEVTSILFTFCGASFLLFGWFGFNGGSAYAANTVASSAVLNTQVTCTVGAISWLIVEYFFRKKPSILGTVNGAVAGLVASAPCSGVVDLEGAFIGGILAGMFCFAGAQVKFYFGFDDALDTFSIHCIGGFVGLITVAFFCNLDLSDQKGSQNVNNYSGIFYARDNSGSKLLGYQMYGIVVCNAWSALMTYIILKVTDRIIGLRVSVDAEDKGLDIAIHDESLVPKSKQDVFGKYVHLTKNVNEEKPTKTATKYEKYQNFIGKYLT